VSRTILAGGRVFDGTGAPVRDADVVAVDGDPFELATLPDRVAAVWQDGRLVAGRA
jgi:imidazolonepropionase-like amidohydrolase